MTRRAAASGGAGAAGETSAARATSAPGNRTKAKRTTARPKALAVLAVAAGLAGVAALACIAAAPQPLSAEQQEAQLEIADLEPDVPDEFPQVDWDYWLGVNPDIVGWVSIPDTNIDHPIVQARADSPEFYLSHGADRSSDAKGCPFLDADCPDGLDSARCVVYGHNWNGGRMFADFARFSDSEFAAEHPFVLLQTPASKRRLKVECVEVAKGTDDTNVTSFKDAEELRCWYQSRYAASCVKLADAPANGASPKRVYTFCTCSYNRWENERTLVYAIEE